MLDPAIASHYELGLEGDRLTRDGRPTLEFVRTMELLDRHLPDRPARILDVGGATGAYSLPLAQRGYDIELVDPVERHVVTTQEAAAEQGLTNLIATLGDARSLEVAERSVDVVLLFGPLYHLTEEADRLTAWSEAIRVTRPGGIVLATAISRFASLLDGVRRQVLSDPTFREVVAADLHTGQHRNPDPIGQPEYFTTAYFHRPDDLEAEAVAAGLSEIALFAVEGPAWLLEDAERQQDALDAARAIESERSLMGASSHIMVVGRTPR